MYLFICSFIYFLITIIFSYSGDNRIWAVFASRPAYEKCIGDEERVSEEVVYVNDYASISQAPPR